MNIKEFKDIKPDTAAKQAVIGSVKEENLPYIGALCALPDEKRTDMRVWRAVGTAAAVVAAVIAVTAWLLIGLGLRNSRVQPEDGEATIDVEDNRTPAGTTENVDRQGRQQQEQPSGTVYRVSCKDGDVTPHKTVQDFVNAYAAGKPCTLVYADGAGTVTCVIDKNGAVKKTTEGTPDGQSYSVFRDDSHFASKLMLDRDAHEYKLFLYGSTAGDNENYAKTDDFNLDFGKADYIKYSGENNNSVFDSAKSKPVTTDKNGEYVSGAESVLYYFRQRARGRYAAMTVNGEKIYFRNGHDVCDTGSGGIGMQYASDVNTVKFNFRRWTDDGSAAPRTLISVKGYNAVSTRLAFCPGGYGYSVFRNGVSAQKIMTEEQMTRLEAAIDAEKFESMPLDTDDLEIDVLVSLNGFNITTFKDGKNVVSVYPGTNASPGWGAAHASDAFIRVLNGLADELVGSAYAGRQTDSFENPLDPARLFSNAEITPPKTAIETGDASAFPKTRKMTYAAMPQGGLGFSAVDEKRNIAPQGAVLTFDKASKLTYAARRYTIGYYKDENGNSYGFNKAGKLVEFLPYKYGDISSATEAGHTDYSPELDRELKNAGKKLARALYGGELDRYEEVEQEYPSGFDYSAWQFTSVSYVIRHGVQTLYSIQVVVYSDCSVYVHVEPEESPDIDYGIYDDLTKENLMELIGRRLKQDAGNDKVYFAEGGEFVFDFIFEYEGHVYQQIAYDGVIAASDGSDFNREATQVYYYRVD